MSDDSINYWQTTNSTFELSDLFVGKSVHELRVRVAS